jgi:hypothetical protein
MRGWSKFAGCDRISSSLEPCSLVILDTIGGADPSNVGHVTFTCWLGWVFWRPAFLSNPLNDRLRVRGAGVDLEQGKTLSRLVKNTSV